MIRVKHFMSEELGKMVGDELGSELWQKGMMNELRRYPNEIPCENGEIPSVIIPKCGGFEKVEWGFTAGMSCLVPKGPGEIEIHNALHFPASAMLALLSLLYDEGAANGKNISLTLHIPENAVKFKEYLGKAMQKLPNVHAAIVPLPAVKDSIGTGYGQFTGGSAVAACVEAQVVDVGRIQFSAKLLSGSFKVGDIAAMTDGDLNVIARYCPILGLSNAAGQDISSTEECGGADFGAYIAAWFPPNSAFDSLYIVNEGDPVFTPARMPEKADLSAKSGKTGKTGSGEEEHSSAERTGGKVVLSKSAVSSGDFVIENGVLKEYTGKGGSVIIPDSVKSIGDWAFSSCTNLTSITIPGSVISIGTGAFKKCESLTDVTIPNSVTNIGDDAFCGCENLTRVFIPKSVSNIGCNAFTKCQGLADQKGFVIVRSVLYDYFGEDSSVIIPNGVTSIGDGAFEECESLTSITIPDSVTSIGDLAFEKCTSLTSVTIPNSVKSIGDWAFDGCESLTGITIPDSVTSIGDGAFQACEGLADQNGFVIIHGVLYGYFGEDNSVIIPNGVTGISCGAFNWCTNLTNITIPNSVTEICDHAFSFCNSLTSITIPNSMKSIGDEAFDGCEKLTTIFIPKSVVTIGDGAFQGCEGLADQNGFVIVRGVLYDYFGEDSSVIIPNGVTGIGRWAFNCCDSMTDVTIPDSVASIGDWAFDSCENLTNITIPNGVTNIGDWAFKGCGSLTSITVPDSVESIGDEAFDGCESLTSITIPKRLEAAFEDCKSIKKINYTDDADRTGSTGKVVLNKSAVSSDDFVIENGMLKKHTGKDGVIVPGSAKSGKTEKAGSGNEKQSYIARIEHEQTNGGWHQYTVILQPGLNYSWEAIIANADSIADADLAPIMNIQLQTAWGVPVDLIKAYKNSGYRFSKTDKLTEDEGNILSIGGISDALGCPTMITWFNQICAFGITTEKERSDEQIRRYAETIIAERFGESAVQAGDSDEEETSSAGSTGSIGSCGIKKVTQCRTGAGENGMFPQGDSEDDTMEMLDLVMGIRKYQSIYRYEIELDSAPLKWSDCLRAANNMICLGVLPEHITYGCGELEAQPETDVTNGLLNNSDFDLRLVPELKRESDFVAVRGRSLDLDVDIKAYFHNGKNLVTLYAPIADKEQIQEYAEMKLCMVLGVDILGMGTKKEKTPAASDDFVIENGVLKKYTGNGGSVIIPDGVTRIDDWAFKGCQTLTSITIPNSVTAIGDHAFLACINLTGVAIPDSVTSIGDEAFIRCKGLADRKGFVIVRNVLYDYFGEDSNVVIPNGVACIGSSAFVSSKNLVRVTIPNSVTSIGKSAFSGRKSLKNITIPDSVTSIGDRAFSSCESLTSITIPGSVTRIGNSAFEGCTSLRKVTIPNSVTHIGDSAFRGCTSLNVTMPNSAAIHIGFWAFDGCTSFNGVATEWVEEMMGTSSSAKKVNHTYNANKGFWKKLFKK